MGRKSHTNERAARFPLANKLLGANIFLLEGHRPILDAERADIPISVEPLIISMSKRHGKEGKVKLGDILDHCQ